MIRRTGVTFVMLLVILGAIAAAAPKPWFLTDEDVYEQTAHEFVVADCSDLQCFRVLVPWVVGRLPGSTVFRWKLYAVLATAGAGLMLGRFCAVAGFTPRASQQAVWLMALGFGPLLTLFNPYTADSLMYLAGPLIAAELLRGRRGRAMWLAIVGVFAKEVAAAPLWIFWLWSSLKRDWTPALRTVAAAVAATLVWVWLQLVLIVEYHYTYGGSKSTDLLHGGDLAVWLGQLGARGAASAVFGSFGALLVLLPAGFMRADRNLRLLVLSSLPAAAVLCYVQQPDRALWNFSYAIIPLAVIVLQQLSDMWGWLFVACYAAANLRVGAQLTFLPAARYPLALSVVIALAAIVATRRHPAAGIGLPAPEMAR